jgi:hypothetical protein
MAKKNIVLVLSYELKNICHKDFEIHYGFRNFASDAKNMWEDDEALPLVKFETEDIFWKSSASNLGFFINFV